MTWWWPYGFPIQRIDHHLDCIGMQKLFKWRHGSHIGLRNKVMAATLDWVCMLKWFVWRHGSHIDLWNKDTATMLDMLVCKNSIWWASNPLCTEPYFNAKHFFCFSDVDDCALFFRYKNCKRIDKPLISEYKYKCIFKTFLKFEDSWYSLKEKLAHTRPFCSLQKGAEKQRNKVSLGLN